MDKFKKAVNAVRAQNAFQIDGHYDNKDKDQARIKSFAQAENKRKEAKLKKQASMDHKNEEHLGPTFDHSFCKISSNA